MLVSHSHAREEGHTHTATHGFHPAAFMPIAHSYLQEVVSLLKKRLRTDNPQKQWLGVLLFQKVCAHLCHTPPLKHALVSFV